MLNRSNIKSSLVYIYVTLILCRVTFQPWNKWDMLHIVRYLLQNGARPAINHGKNSALACVLRQVRYNKRIYNY